MAPSCQLRPATSQPHAPDGRTPQGLAQRHLAARLVVSSVHQAPIAHDSRFQLNDDIYQLFTLVLATMTMRSAGCPSSDEQDSALQRGSWLERDGHSAAISKEGMGDSRLNACECMCIINQNVCDWNANRERGLISPRNATGKE